MRYRLVLSLATVALFATLALGSGYHGSSPTAAHPELDPGVEAPQQVPSAQMDSRHRNTGTQCLLGVVIERPSLATMSKLRIRENGRGPNRH